MALKPSALGAITLGVTDPSVRRALQLTAERLQVWEGSRGNPLDQVLTLRDLTSDTGVLSIIRGSGADGLNGSPLVGGIRWGDRTPPPAPVNLQAQGAFNSIVLTCEFPLNYPWLSHFEWWRSTDDNLGHASLVLTSLGPIASDQVASGSEFYYWVRAVAQGDTPIYGPFNAAEGTVGQTDMDPAYLLDVLTDAITATQLHSDLTSKIDSIDDLQTAVNGALSEISAINATLADLNSIAAFDSGTSYAEDDLFTHDGALYRVIAPTTAPSPTPPNPTYYEQIGDYASLADAVTAHAAILSDHETRITTSEGDIVSLTSSYSALAAGLTAANGNITANAAAIAATQATVTSQGGTISSHTSQLNTLSSNYTALNGSLSGLSSTVSALSTTVTNQGNTLTAQASQLSSISATVAGHTTSINNQAAILTAVQASVTSQGSTVTALSSTVTALSATVGTNSAAITIEAAVRAAAVAPNYSGSTAYGLNSLVVFNNSVYRGKAASIPVGTVPTNTTYWEPYTTTTASYVLKLDVNGKIAGFGLENTGTASLFEIVADKFAVVTSTGSGTVAPFIVSGGAVYLASAIIQAASISVAKVQSAFMDSLVAAQGTLVSAHIGDLQITSGKIAATLQSNNFVAGTSGWAINKSGTMELNELTARGTLTASNVIGSYIAGSYMSAPSIYTAGSHAVVAVTAGATSVTLKDVSGFSNSGTGIIYGATNNRDTFTWTGRNTSTNQLTGIVTTGGNALLAHPVGSIVVQSNVPTIMISPAAGEFYLRGDRGDGVIEELATIGNSQIGSDFYIARFGGTGNRAGVWASSGSSTGVVAVSSTGPGMEARSTSGLALSALSTNGPGASVGGGKTQYDLQIITPLVSGDPALPTHDTSPARSVIQGRAAIGQPARLFYNGTGDGEDWAEFVCQKPARPGAISGVGSISGTFARGFWYIRPNTDTAIISTVNGAAASKTVPANSLEYFYSDGDVSYSSTGSFGTRTINYRYIPT